MLMVRADGHTRVTVGLGADVLSSALGSTARGHDQVHVPCILLFKRKSVGHCLLVRVVW